MNCATAQYFFTTRGFYLLTMMPGVARAVKNEIRGVILLSRLAMAMKNAIITLITDRLKYYTAVIKCIPIVGDLHAIICDYVTSYRLADYPCNHKVSLIIKNPGQNESQGSLVVSIIAYTYWFMNDLNVPFIICTYPAEGIRSELTLYNSGVWNLGQMNRYYKTGDTSSLVKPVHDILIGKIGLTRDGGNYLAYLLTRHVLNGLIEPSSDGSPIEYIGDEYIEIKGVALTLRPGSSDHKKYKRRRQNRRQRH